MRRGEERKMRGKEQNKGEKENCYTEEEALCPHADTLRRGTAPACTALCPLTACRLSRTPCAQSAKQPGGGRGREKRENWPCRRRFGAAWPCLGGAFSLKAPFDPKAPSLWKAPVWAACCSKGGTSSGKGYPFPLKMPAYAWPALKSGARRSRPAARRQTTWRRAVPRRLPCRRQGGRSPWAQAFRSGAPYTPARRHCPCSAGRGRGKRGLQKEAKLLFKQREASGRMWGARRPLGAPCRPARTA